MTYPGAGTRVYSRSLWPDMAEPRGGACVYEFRRPHHGYADRQIEILIVRSKFFFPETMMDVPTIPLTLP
jgi:hypothetical protein